MAPSVLLLTPEGGRFVCDSRYTVQAGKEITDLQVVENRQRQEGIADLVRQAGLSGWDLRLPIQRSASRAWQPGSRVSLVALGPELDTIRNCKDADELEQLAQVAALGSAAFLMRCCRRFTLHARVRAGPAA